MGPRIPLRIRHLFKPPIIRQWIHGRYYYGEREDREPSRSELVFDLVAVGMVHAAADNLSEYPATAYTVALLAFQVYMAWVLWMDQLRLIGTMGTDDLPQRMVLLLIMLMMIGLISQVRDIHIGTLRQQATTTTSSTSSSSSSMSQVTDLGKRVLGQVLAASQANGQEEQEEHQGGKGAGSLNLDVVGGKLIGP